MNKIKQNQNKRKTSDFSQGIKRKINQQEIDIVNPY